MIQIHFIFTQLTHKNLLIYINTSRFAAGRLWPRRYPALEEVSLIIPNI